MADMTQIGLRSLIAYKNALNTSTLNIANVGTAYYSRRQVTLVEALYGNGVDVGSVNRIYNGLLSQSVKNANSNLGMSNSLSQALSVMESILQSPNDSVNNYLNDALKALKGLDADTTSSTNRKLFLDKLTSLANKFNWIGNQLSQEQTNINSTINTTISSVNSTAAQLAEINNQIKNQPGTDISQLLDQQEALVQTLAGSIDFTVTDNADGSINIQLANGTPLVNGATSTTLSTIVDPMNTACLRIVAKNGNSNIDVTDTFASGSIYGLYQSQSALLTAQKQLNIVGLNIADLFNKQNAKGVDANGNLGGNIFSDINNASIMLNRSRASTGNTGNEQMSVSISDSTKLVASDYSLTFDTSNHYILTRLSDQQVVSTGSTGTLPASINIDGFTLSIGNTAITAGDSFIISPTSNGATNLATNITDPKLLALAWPVTTSINTNNTGKGSINVTNIIDTTNSAFSNPQALNPPITIKFTSASTFQIINANTNAIMEDNIPYNAATGSTVFPTPGGYDPGYRISLSGPINANDQFNIGYNIKSLGNDNGIAFENIFATGNFSTNYRLLADEISVTTNHANIQLTSNTTIAAQALTQFNQVSGVSLEEETSNMILYQQAYQASAKILEVSNNIFEVLIGLTRG